MDRKLDSDSASAILAQQRATFDSENTAAEIRIARKTDPHPEDIEAIRARHHRHYDGWEDNHNMQVSADIDTLFAALDQVRQQLAEAEKLNAPTLASATGPAETPHLVKKETPPNVYLRDHEEAAETPRWQSIATAPRDPKTFLLLYSPSQGVTLGSALDGEEWEADGGGLLEPTHWQPLPDPPKDPA